MYASYGPTAWQLLCIPTSFRTRHRTARPPNAWTQARDTIATSSKGIATSSKGITTSSKVSQTIHVWNIIGTVAYMKEAQSSHRQSCKMWRTLLGVDDFGSKTWIEQTHEHVHLLSAQKSTPDCAYPSSHPTNITQSLHITSLPCPNLPALQQLHISALFCTRTWTFEKGCRMDFHTRRGLGSSWGVFSSLRGRAEFGRYCTGRSRLCFADLFLKPGHRGLQRLHLQA